MFGLAVIDLVVIFIYFAFLIGIGFWAMRPIRNQEDFSLGGRRFGKLVLIFAASGQLVYTSSAVSTTTTTVANGASGIWSTLQ